MDEEENDLFMKTEQLDDCSPPGVHNSASSPHSALWKMDQAIHDPTNDITTAGGGLNVVYASIDLDQHQTLARVLQQQTVSTVENLQPNTTGLTQSCTTGEKMGAKPSEALFVRCLLGRCKRIAPLWFLGVSSLRERNREENRRAATTTTSDWSSGSKIKSELHPSDEFGVGTSSPTCCVDPSTGLLTDCPSGSLDFGPTGAGTGGRVGGSKRLAPVVGAQQSLADWGAIASKIEDMTTVMETDAVANLLKKLYKELPAESVLWFIKCWLRFPETLADNDCVLSRGDAKGRMRRIDGGKGSDKVWRLDTIVGMLYHGLPMSSTDTNIMVHTCEQELCVRPQHLRFRASSVALVVVLKALQQAGYQIIPPPPSLIDEESGQCGILEDIARGQGGDTDEFVDVFGPFTIEQLQQYRSENLTPSEVSLCKLTPNSYDREILATHPLLKCHLSTSQVGEDSLPNPSLNSKRGIKRPAPTSPPPGLEPQSQQQQPPRACHSPPRLMPTNLGINPPPPRGVQVAPTPVRISAFIPLPEEHHRSNGSDSPPILVSGSSGSGKNTPRQPAKKRLEARTPTFDFEEETNGAGPMSVENMVCDGPQQQQGVVPTFRVHKGTLFTPVARTALPSDCLQASMAPIACSSPTPVSRSIAAILKSDQINNGHVLTIVPQGSTSTPNNNTLNQVPLLVRPDETDEHELAVILGSDRAGVIGGNPGSHQTRPGSATAGIGGMRVGDQMIILGGAGTGGAAAAGATGTVTMAAPGNSVDLLANVVAAVVAGRAGVTGGGRDAVRASPTACMLPSGFVSPIPILAAVHNSNGLSGHQYHVSDGHDTGLVNGMQRSGTPTNNSSSTMAAALLTNALRNSPKLLVDACRLSPNCSDLVELLAGLVQQYGMNPPGPLINRPDSQLAHQFYRNLLNGSLSSSPNASSSHHHLRNLSFTPLGVEPSDAGQMQPQQTNASGSTPQHHHVMSRP